MEIRKVFVITHPDKGTGANPRLTEAGMIQARSLYPKLPKDISGVIIGCGWRHFDTATALGLNFSVVSPIVGLPDSLERKNGDRVVVLASGHEIPEANYRTMDLTPSTVAFVLDIPDRTLLISGRPFMICLGKDDAKSGAIYEITIDGSEIMNMEEVPVAE